MKPHFHIGVSELVEQTLRSGDINFRFSSRSSALEGIKGHQRLQKSRNQNYRAEKQLSDRIEWDDLSLEISGRVDGYYPDEERFIVEEIKTIRVDVDLIPEGVRRMHWGQVRIYGLLLARLHGITRLTLRLCYLDLDEDQEFQFDEIWTIERLQDFYDDLIEQYVSHLRQLLIWTRSRDGSIRNLDFPHPNYRAGQREMAVSVYRTLKNEQQLVIQAPTGIGKTIASIFPAVKALNELQYDKLFFLSAKTSGQEMARKAIADLRESGLKIRDITLTAKDKVCFNPGSPCDPEHCEYARNYYDRLPQVIESVLESDVSLDREEIRKIALQQSMCPFELSLDLSLISDIVICDYNYVFDPVVYLRRYFENKKARYALLMDESHNLVDRGRDMFSAEFWKDDVLAVRRLFKDESPPLAKRLARLNAEFLAILKPHKDELKKKDGIRLDNIPATFSRAMRQFNETAEDWLQLNKPGHFQAELLELYFSALRFSRTLELADKNTAYLLLRRNSNTCLKLYCLNPGPRLAEGFDRVSASVCFSATMTPQPYFNTLMGISENADWYQIESPFPPENSIVLTTSYIATTYQHRSDSLYELVDTLAAIIATRAGNYMAYFPSHAYLAEVSGKFRERYPEAETVIQTPSMNEDEREIFLATFEPGRRQLGFAVMGGIFGEGIDLKGSRLIGAIIVGVGLPQLGLERNLIRDYFDQAGGPGNVGFEFAYQYPGMNRVLQTAGRVIRSENDRGIICLIDHRFNEARYRRQFPTSWQPLQARSRPELIQLLKSFWQ